MLPEDLIQRPIFRMVHYQNIEYILKNGMCCRKHLSADANYINIGDTTLIQQRNEYSVHIDPPGGFLGDYVPFYFGGHSPMLLNIKTGYRGITQHRQEDIVFICCKINRIVELCDEWCFTDGHAKDKLSEFYNDLHHLDKVDWVMVYEQWWNPKEEDFDRQRRKQAEFLVKQHVPVDCFHCLVVKNQSKKDDLVQIVENLGLNIPVKIDNNNKLFYP